jgi:hypothetical protein
MILGGIVQATMGVEAAQRDLEDIAPPLSAQEAELDEAGEDKDPYTVGADEGRGTAHAQAGNGGTTGRFERDGADQAAGAEAASRIRPTGGNQ